MFFKSIYKCYTLCALSLSVLLPQIALAAPANPQKAHTPLIGIPDAIGLSEQASEQGLMCAGSNEFCQRMHQYLIFALSESSSVFKVLERKRALHPVIQQEKRTKSLHSGDPDDLEAVPACDYLLTGFVDQQNGRIEVILNLMQIRNAQTFNLIHLSVFDWELPGALKQLKGILERKLLRNQGQMPLSDVELNRIQTILDLALDYYNRAYYAEATTLAQIALTLESENLMAWRILGTSQLQVKEYAQALVSFDHILKAHTTDASARLNRAIVRYELKQWPQALADLNSLLQESSAPALWYAYRAQIQSALGNCQAMQQDLATACRKSSQECQRTLPCPLAPTESGS